MTITYQSIGIELPVREETNLLRQIVCGLSEQSNATSSVDAGIAVLQEASERAITMDRNRRAMELLRQWSEEGDAEEQRESLAALMKGLNEHHSSGRRVFK